MAGETGGGGTGRGLPLRAPLISFPGWDPGVGPTMGVQKVRGPTKKENEFYDETRREACDVSKTTPDAVTSQSVLLLGSGCWLF